MKVTPIDIRHKEFRRSMRGYSEEEVDVFLDEVADDFELLFKENLDLQDQIHRLKEQAAQYETLKETLQKTLISAQQQADETRANARKEAELILKDAELKARNNISESYTEKQKVQQSIVQLRQLEDDFRFKFKSLLEAHLNLLMEDEASEERRRPRGVGNGSVSDGEAEKGTAARAAEPSEPAAESTAEAGKPVEVDAPAVRTPAAGAGRAAVPENKLAPAREEAEIPPVQQPAPSASAAPVELPPAWLGASDAPTQKAPPANQPTPERTSASPDMPTRIAPRPAAPGSPPVEKRVEKQAEKRVEAAPAPAPLAERLTQPAQPEDELGDLSDFDFDFDLNEPEEGPSGAVGATGAAKKESSVRRFFFGSKNSARDGRDKDRAQGDDRDFDW